MTTIVVNRSDMDMSMMEFDRRVMNGSVYAGEVNVTLPREMLFTDDSLVSVVTYGILFIIAAVGNLTVFNALYRNRKRRSRVNLFIMHLSVADMIVTFIMMPMEIGWHVTVSWKAGDAGCRVFMFFRAFGFYLSSFILIAISLDRYFAVTRPLSLNDAGKRGKLMLLLAWLFSILASIPQSVIFHVENHPQYPWFSQCVTFHFFPTTDHELAYNLFNIFMVYLIPLLVIVVCYSLILVEMCRLSSTHIDTDSPPPSTRSNKLKSRSHHLRRSDNGRMQRAKMHTLKMTIVIVMAFIVCWTPYFVILSWWWFDRDSAILVNPKVQRGLFIFAVSNSCVNPIIYGMFSTAIRRDGIMQSCRAICSCFSSTSRVKSPSQGHPNHNNGMMLNKFKHIANKDGGQSCRMILPKRGIRTFVHVPEDRPSRHSSSVLSCGKEVASCPNMGDPV